MTNQEREQTGTEAALGKQTWCVPWPKRATTQDIPRRGLKMTESVSLTSRLPSTEERLNTPNGSVEKLQ